MWLLKTVRAVARRHTLTPETVRALSSRQLVHVRFKWIISPRANWGFTPTRLLACKNWRAYVGFEPTIRRFGHAHESARVTHDLVAPAGIEPENPGVSRPDITRGGYNLVPGMRLELTRLWLRPLKAAWLPITPPGQNSQAVFATALHS